MLKYLTSFFLKYCLYKILMKMQQHQIKFNKLKMCYIYVSDPKNVGEHANHIFHVF